MAFNPQPQTRYGHCESYFVVSDDEEFNLVADRKKEQTRAIARAHQRQLGFELSRITADEYQEDILDHMEFMESETMPDVNSIDIQTEIQWYMRPYLLDFLIEAHSAFQLLPETLFLTINLLDRYCSRRVVYKRHYQLVGCAALLIASKYGDKKERVPTVRELRSMCCALYDEEMFIQMEWHVLQTLNWVIGHPTIDSFLQIALDEDEHADIEAQHMTWYICELALFHKEFVSVRPSVLARSALALSRCILGRQHTQQTDWSNRYDATVILNLATYLSSPSQVLARKYGSNQLSSVASTVAYFVQQQNQKTTVVAEPTRPIVEDHSPPLGNPQTPQKPPYGAAVMTNGCLTPPITPENEQSFQNGFTKSAIPPPPRFPPTPSPITRVEPPTVPSPYEHQNAYHSYMRPHFVR